MNRPVNTAELKPAVTTGPLPSSRKIFVTPDEAPDVRVPLREIILSEGAGEPNLPVYDTSGPYTDSDVVIDVNKGLRRHRTAWVLERGGVEEYEGRPGQAVDNGNVSSDKAAKAFSAYHKPLRGVDSPPPCGEGSGVGVSREELAWGYPPPPTPPPPGGGGREG